MLDDTGKTTESTEDSPVGSETMKLVRATMRLAIDPALVAHDPEAHKTRNKDKTRGCRGPEFCRGCRLVKDLYEQQRQWADAANAITRYLWHRDALRLDAFVVEHGRFPTSKELKDVWPAPPSRNNPHGKGEKFNAYAYAKHFAPTMRGANRSVVARYAETQKWMKERFEALVKLGRDPAHFRTRQGKMGAFSLRKDSIKIRKTKRKDRYEVGIMLHPGKFPGGAEYWIPVDARDARMRTILDKLESGEWKHGDMKIENDRRGRWYMRVSYSRFIPKTTHKGAAAINRGLRCFLAAVTEAGEHWIYDGHDIEAALRQFERRRKQYQYDAKASSRSGRGRTRILVPTEVLRGKARRWRDTKIAVIARRFAQWLVSRGIGVLYYEDFTGIRNGEEDSLAGGKMTWDRIQEWPYYELQQKIVSCCEEYGVACVKVAAHYISQTCPRCGTVDPENRDLRFWRLRCTKDGCGFKRHLDVAAAMNVLARGKKLRAN